MAWHVPFTGGSTWLSILRVYKVRSRPAGDCPLKDNLGWRGDESALKNFFLEHRARGQPHNCLNIAPKAPKTHPRHYGGMCESIHECPPRSYCRARFVTLTSKTHKLKVKHNQLPCNYRVFFDADDELISCAIYPEAYGWDATTTPVDGWMLLSTNTSMQLALEAPQPQQLALMPPTGEMDACD